MHHTNPFRICLSLLIAAVIQPVFAQTIFLDDFNVANTTNLNDGIATRQVSGVVTSTYTSGSSDDVETNDTSSAIANMKLEFVCTGDVAGGNDEFATPDINFGPEVAGAVWTLSHTVELDFNDPLFDEEPNDGWFSLMLDDNPVGVTTGPNTPGVPLAVLVRLDGRFNIWSAGAQIVNAPAGTLSGNSHTVEFTIDEFAGTKTGTVVIDGVIRLENHPLTVGPDRYVGLRTHIGGAAGDEFKDMIARVDDLKLEILSSPALALDSIEVGTETGIEITGDDGVQHALQFTLDPAATSQWQNAGVEFVGTGAAQVVFDPAGYSPQKTYRALGGGPPGAATSADPGTPLTDFTTLGEWETNDDFEGWTQNNVTDPTVTNGALQGSAASGDPQIIQVFTNGTFPSGATTPDLDAPENKTLEFGISIETGTVSRVDVFYGTTASPGINPARMVSVPAPSVIADGTTHVYQLHLEEVAAWQGNLERIRFDPMASPDNIGKSFSLDYIRIGSRVIAGSPIAVDNALAVEFDSDPGKSYEFQSSGPLPSNIWDLVSSVAATGGTVRVVDSAPADTNKFYRVEIK